MKPTTLLALLGAGGAFYLLSGKANAATSEDDTAADDDVDGGGGSAAGSSGYGGGGESAAGGGGSAAGGGIADGPGNFRVTTGVPNLNVNQQGYGTDVIANRDGIATDEPEGGNVFVAPLGGLTLAPPVLRRGGSLAPSGASSTATSTGTTVVGNSATGAFGSPAAGSTFGTGSAFGSPAAGSAFGTTTTTRQWAAPGVKTSTFTRPPLGQPGVKTSTYQRGRFFSQGISEDVINNAQNKNRTYLLRGISRADHAALCLLLDFEVWTALERPQKGPSRVDVATWQEAAAAMSRVCVDIETWGYGAELRACTAALTQPIPSKTNPRDRGYMDLDPVHDGQNLPAFFSAYFEELDRLAFFGDPSFDDHRTNLFMPLAIARDTDFPFDCILKLLAQIRFDAARNQIKNRQWMHA